MTIDIYQVTRKEILTVLKYAVADLQGAKQCFEQGCYADHDWKAHQLTIEEISQTIAKLDNGAK